MELKEIINKIADGLTGDIEKDLEYLNQQEGIYKNHENAKEILRAIGRMMAEIIPEERKEELKQFLQNRKLGADAVIDEAQYAIYKKDYNKAYQILKSYVDEIENLGFYEDDQLSEYHYFNEFAEEIIYSISNQVQKDIRHIHEDYNKVYYFYGYVLIELERIEEARKALRVALKWNPMDINTHFEYIETFKNVDLEKFYSNTKDLLKICYKREQIARVYRNIGYYYVEKKQYETAFDCYFYSLLFENKNDKAMSELYYIQSAANKKFEEPSPKKLNTEFKMNGIPTAPDQDLLSILYYAGSQFEENNNNEAAVYFYRILNDLINDDEIQGKIDKLSGLDLDKMKQDDLISYDIIMFQRDKTKENLMKLILDLGRCDVIVPMSVRISNQDMNNLINAKKGDEFTLQEEMGLKPDILENKEGKKFFPVFTSEEQIPEEYGKNFHRLKQSFINCISLIQNFDDVDSVIINAFSENSFEVNPDLLDLISEESKTSMS